MGIVKPLSKVFNALMNFDVTKVSPFCANVVNKSMARIDAVISWPFDKVAVLFSSVSAPAVPEFSYRTDPEELERELLETLIAKTNDFLSKKPDNVSHNHWRDCAVSDFIKVQIFYELSNAEANARRSEHESSISSRITETLVDHVLQWKIEPEIQP